MVRDTDREEAVAFRVVRPASGGNDSSYATGTEVVSDPSQPHDHHFRDPVAPWLAPVIDLVFTRSSACGPAVAVTGTKARGAAS